MLCIKKSICHESERSLIHIKLHSLFIKLMILVYFTAASVSYRHPLASGPTQSG